MPRLVLDDEPVLAPQSRRPRLVLDEAPAQSVPRLVPDEPDAFDPTPPIVNADMEPRRSVAAVATSGVRKVTDSMIPDLPKSPVEAVETAAKPFSPRSIDTPTTRRVAGDVAAGALGTVSGGAGVARYAGMENFGRKVTEFTDQAIREMSPPDPNFVDSIVRGFGSMATFYIPGAGVTSGAARLAYVAPKLAKIFGVGAATLLESLVEAGSVYNESLAKGEPPEYAKNNANLTLFSNLPAIYITNKLGIFAEGGNALARGAKGAASEALQEFTQQLISNTALADPLMKDAFESALVGAVTGGGTSTIASAVETGAEAPVMPPLPASEPVAEPLAPAPATLEQPPVDPPLQPATTQVGSPPEAIPAGPEAVSLEAEAPKARLVLDETPPQSEGFDSPVRIQEPQERIKVAPIEGQPPKPLKDIVFDASKGLERKVFFGKPSPKAGGTYYPGSAATVVKYSGDLDTTAHELAHSLDDRLGIVSDQFDDELAQFWVHGSATETGPKSALSYKRAEGVAEYIRAWLVNPEAAEEAAPRFSEYLLSKLPAKTAEALTQFSADIRSFAGATAHEKVMANVNWKPPEDTIAKFLTGGNTDPGPGFHLTWADKTQAALQDSLKAFTKAVDYARGERGIDELLPASDPVTLGRLFSGVHAKMDDIFEKGMVDAKNERSTSGGVRWLFESLDQTSSESLEKDAKEVTSYMIAERTIEKAKQNESKRVSGIGGGMERDYDVAVKRLKVLEANPKKLERIKEAASRYRQWADATLRYMVDKGRMSEEQYKQIKENNEYYVAMQRVMEVSPNEEIVVYKGQGGGKLGTSSNPIKRFLGSTRAIENPYTSLMENTYRAIRESDRNEVMRTFRDLLTSNRGMNEGQVADLASVGRKAKAEEKNTISIFVDGKQEHWQFQPDVYKALKGITEAQYMLPGWMTILPRIMRSTIVNSPPFAVRNTIRDTFERLVKSDTGASPMDYFKKKNPMDLECLKLYGGDQSGHYMADRKDYMRAMSTAMREMSKDDKSILIVPSKFGKAYMNLMHSSEYVNRLAEFKTARAYAKLVKGMDDYNANLYAASKARGLLDFAIVGNQIRVLNQIIPFTNAGIQGLTRTVNAARTDPKGFAVRWSLYILAPTLLTWVLNHANGDDKEYQQMPAYVKDMFWNVKLAPDLWLRIPKPFEIGVMATGVERALQAATGDSKAFEGYAGSVARSLMPVDETAFLGPVRGIGSVLANWDFFRGRNIIPPNEQKLDVDLRKTERASRLGQMIQKATGMDARNIDFLMREQFGYAGQFASDLSDVGRKDRRGLGLNQTGLTTTSPAYAARDVQWVMDIAARRGMTTRHDYKSLMGLQKAYFSAQGGRAKDAAAEKLRNSATHLRAQWEAQGLPDKSGIKKKKEPALFK